MGDTYHYEDGAMHLDHRKVIQIEHFNGRMKDVLRDFMEEDAEEVDVVSELDAAQVPVMPHTEVDVEGAPREKEEQNLNFKTPRIVLQNMLKAEDVRPLFDNPQKYTQKWTDQFISSLMSSEHGAYIAKKWAENDQRLLLKGYIFGMLSKAGVLKGNKISIARAYLNISANTNVPELKKKVNTFSSYMSQSRWKNEPYADWVLEHIGGSQKEA